jgi:hypothetical protein
VTIGPIILPVVFHNVRWKARYAHGICGGLTEGNIVPDYVHFQHRHGQFGSCTRTTHHEDDDEGWRRNSTAIIETANYIQQDKSVPTTGIYESCMPLRNDTYQDRSATDLQPDCPLQLRGNHSWHCQALVAVPRQATPHQPAARHTDKNMANRVPVVRARQGKPAVSCLTYQVEVLMPPT